jgi:hypothetical protein
MVSTEMVHRRCRSGYVTAVYSWRNVKKKSSHALELLAGFFDAFT